MGVFDQAARYAATADPSFVVRRLHPLVGLPLAFRGWLDTKAVPLPGGPDREADLVAVADEPAGPWLLIFEVQSRHDPDKLKVLHLEAMVYLCYARDADRDGGAFRPLPVFVYLTGRCPERRLAIETPTGLGSTGTPAIWDVAEDDAAETLARVEAGDLSWGALFWVSLMNGVEDEAVIEHWRRLVQEKVPEGYRADVVYVALVFAELAGCRLAWNRAQEGVKMTESAVANEMIELGEMRATREALLDYLATRFPEVMTADVQRAIADQPSLDLLKAWRQAAYRAATPDDFLAVLRR